MAKYMTKGNKVTVTGDYSKRSYEDKQGVTRYITECVCDDIEFDSPMGEKKDSGALNDRDREPADFEPMDDEQMPF